MSSRLRFAALALWAVAACSTESSSSLPTPGTLTVTATPDRVASDGVATVTIDVSGIGSPPATVIATRGTFESTGTDRATITGAAGELTLVACDERSDPLCWGTVRITASDASLASGSTRVTFVGTELCSNGVADHGNTLVDCANPSCAAQACLAAGGGTGACASGACVCTADAGQAAAETSCTDGRDNDCDGPIDCADPDCAAQACASAGGGIGSCAQGACVCVVAEPAGEVTCDDARDGDCDGSVDCDDTGCDGLACDAPGGGAGRCAGRVCVPASCTRTADTEVSCDDHVDDDCNGLVDCQEPACAGRQCDGASAAWVCRASACTDLSSGFALRLAPARPRIPADGLATTPVTVSVSQGDEPYAGQTVILSTDVGGFVSGASTLQRVTLTTDARGEATATFVSTAQGGTATLRAEVGAAQISTAATVRMPALAQIELKPAPALPVMGVKDSGWNEANAVSVTLTGDDGLPYPDGLAVRFEHERLGGSELAGPVVACASGSANCLAQVGSTASPGSGPDTLGQAQVTLYSGTVAGTVVVTATATGGGRTRSYTLQPGMPILGAKPSAGAFTVVCGPENVPGLERTDCGASLVDTSFTCVAVLQDRFSNMVGRQSTVTFRSEAGRVGPVATTPAYVPGTDPTTQGQLGTATQLIGTLGGFLPEDVPPVAGEPRIRYANACGDLEHNPRDGVVTVVAITDGEEAFTDLNGDGRFEAGEPFVDLPEPFLDVNDDGIHQATEWFLDADGDGAWSARNGQWDVNAKIWTQTVVVYTGAAMPPTADPLTPGQYLGTRWAGPLAGAGAPATCQATPAPGAFALVAGETPTSERYAVYASDGNLNMLFAGTTYGVAAMAPATVKIGYGGLASYPDMRGFSYTYRPCDQAGACGTRCLSTAAGPCEMRATVRDFSCGIGAPVTITGGSDTDPGTDFVGWTAATSPAGAVTVTVSGTSIKPPPPP